MIAARDAVTLNTTVGEDRQPLADRVDDLAEHFDQRNRVAEIATGV